MKPHGRIGLRGAVHVAVSAASSNSDLCHPWLLSELNSVALGLLLLLLSQLLYLLPSRPKKRTEVVRKIPLQLTGRTGTTALLQLLGRSSWGDFFNSL